MFLIYFILLVSHTILLHSMVPDNHPIPRLPNDVINIIFTKLAHAKQPTSPVDPNPDSINPEVRHSSILFLPHTDSRQCEVPLLVSQTKTAQDAVENTNHFTHFSSNCNNGELFYDKHYQYFMPRHYIVSQDHYPSETDPTRIGTKITIIDEKNETGIGKICHSLYTAERTSIIHDGPNEDSVLLIGRNAVVDSDKTVSRFSLFKLTGTVDHRDFPYTSKEFPYNIHSLALARSKHFAYHTNTKKTCIYSYDENLKATLVAQDHTPYLKKLCFITARTLLGLSPRGQLYSIGVQPDGSLSCKPQHIRLQNSPIDQPLQEICVDPVHPYQAIITTPDGDTYHAYLKKRPHGHITLRKIASSAIQSLQWFYDDIYTCIDFERKQLVQRGIAFFPKEEFVRGLQHVNLTKQAADHS